LAAPSVGRLFKRERGPAYHAPQVLMAAFAFVDLNAPRVLKKMQPALKFQFERAVGEYALWQAVPSDERSEAAAWWWGTAIAAVDETATMPVEWCATLGVADESSYAEGAAVFMKALAGQTYLPWPDGFPGKSKAIEAD
jgi:hypothetical protein